MKGKANGARRQKRKGKAKAANPRVSRNKGTVRNAGLVRNPGRLRIRKRPVCIATVLVFVIIAFMISNFLGIPGEPQTYVSEQELMQELMLLDIVNAYPNNLGINIADYPKDLGVYAENGMRLNEVYYCSDLCPDSGAVIIIFDDVARDECLVAGGREYLDPAWGGYVGCTPDLERFSIQNPVNYP